MYRFYPVISGQKERTHNIIYTQNVITILIILYTHLEPDQVLVFEIEIDSAFETLSVMSTVVISDRHQMVAVRVLQVTGEG